MADINCSACQDLRNDAPNVVVNGIGTTEVTSLMNNTGLSPSNSNNDCTDLNNLNDCLIGNLGEEIESYDVCEWKPFMKRFVPNAWTVNKGVISAICGLWAKFSYLCSQLGKASYIGIMTLYTTDSDNESTGTGADAKTVVLPFENNSVVGNLPSGVFTALSNNKGIRVSNTTDVPLLINATYNCSIRTSQRIASCYLTITRDGSAVGQTPFITPTTYDQQVKAEPFILQPGQSSTVEYYFGVGSANNWYNNTFALRPGETTAWVHAKHERKVASNPENQRSYFSVEITSVPPATSC